MDYYFPFLVTGLLPLLPALLATLMISTNGTSDTSESISILSLLKIPGIVIMSLAMFLTAGPPIMLQPILAPHLKMYSLSISVIGLVFLISPLSYATSTPIVGKIFGRLKSKLPMMIFGTFAMGITFLFFGPSPLIDAKQYEMLWPTLVSLVAIGAFNAAIVVPNFERIVTYGKMARPDVDPEMLMTALGSFVWMMTYIGDFIATTLAGTIYDAYGFSWTTTVAAMLCFSAGIMLLLTYLMFGDKEITCKPCGSKSGEKQALVPRKNINDID